MIVACKCTNAIGFFFLPGNDIDTHVSIIHASAVSYKIPKLVVILSAMKKLDQIPNNEIIINKTFEKYLTSKKKLRFFFSACRKRYSLKIT